MSFRRLAPSWNPGALGRSLVMDELQDRIPGSESPGSRHAVCEESPWLPLRDVPKPFIKQSEEYWIGLRARLIELKTEDLRWSFDGGAQFTIKSKYGFERTETVDPFPCYAHDLALVTSIVRGVEAAFPVGFLPTYYILHHEVSDRTNGHTNLIFDTNGNLRNWDPYIVLSGKRIPLHPGMTRSLIAHEYGLVVRYWINRQHSISPVTAFDHEYLALRPEAETGAPRGREWHAQLVELIADDFRICVTGIDREYWPHPGFRHPDMIPDIREFWSRMVKEFAYRPEITSMGLPDKGGL